MKMMGLSNTIGHFIYSKIIVLFSLFLTSDEANIESMLMLLKRHMLSLNRSDHFVWYVRLGKKKTSELNMMSITIMDISQ